MSDHSATGEGLLRPSGEGAETHTGLLPNRASGQGWPAGSVETGEPQTAPRPIQPPLGWRLSRT
jgi:hypothetical protein